MAVPRRQARQGLLGGGCTAILLLHLKNPRILRKSAATRVARQGVPAHVCNYGNISQDGFRANFLISRIKIAPCKERVAREKGKTERNIQRNTIFLRRNCSAEFFCRTFGVCVCVYVCVCMCVCVYVCVFSAVRTENVAEKRSPKNSA